jgi:hypothetical protein
MGQLSTVAKKFGQGGTFLSDGALRDNLNLLLGYTKVTFAGAAAGTKMNAASLRKGDTIIHALVATDAGGAQVDDSANMTIQETRSQGTVTITGNPVDGETMVVGRFTYTWKTTPTALGHVKITAGNNNQMASDLAAAITAVENGRSTYTVANTLVGSAPQTPELSCVASTNTVVVTSLTDGPGNAITATGTATRLAVTGSGTGSVTWTAAAVANNDTFAITDQTGAVITFTIKDAPVVGTLTDVQRTTASDTAMALNVANAIKAYQFKFGNLGVTASAVAAVVTAVPVDPLRGNITPFTEAVTNLACDGAGVLGGTNSGTNTGGVKSATNLTSKSVTLTYFHKTTFATA